jgi:O-acetyl-ADP-ribose deacetylase (regulator of RNase III)
MTIIIKQGDLTGMSCDALVNPANSFGYMGGGVAGALKRRGGGEIEKEALSKAPIKIGHAVATTGGSLSCRYVIHAPTMQRPAMSIPVENVRQATRAALNLAVNMNLTSIALPGMGTGVGGVSYEAAAEAMMGVIKQYEKQIETIILVDRNKEMIEAFRRFL